MASTTTVNGRTVVHEGSGGLSAAFPDVCLTPSGPVPVPYPNVARSADLVRGSETVAVDGQPVAVKGSAFGRSTGDEAGVQKGVVSGAVMGEARFQNWSFDVKIEGRNACRLLDPMSNNGGSPTNTPPTPEVQPPRAGGPEAAVEISLSHVVRVGFVYAHPDPWTERKEPVRLETGYDLVGPESETWAPPFSYASGVCGLSSPGEYQLAFQSFDRAPRPLVSDAAGEDA